MGRTQNVKIYTDYNCAFSGMKSFWVMFKRGHKGIYHKFSGKHLQHYFNDCRGCHDVREVDTIDQMGDMIHSMQGKHIRYWELIVPNGRSSAARLTKWNRPDSW